MFTYKASSSVFLQENFSKKDKTSLDSQEVYGMFDDRSIIYTLFIEPNIRKQTSNYVRRLKDFKCCIAQRLPEFAKLWEPQPEKF